ncbi:MAG: hypothetical protein FD152_340 [Xanthobacteraceae bacterium]|nr:MAG: hypothetical protein FD152_340 [Xanthobacteraceae bacterium]
MTHHIDHRDAFSYAERRRRAERERALALRAVWRRLMRTVRRWREGEARQPVIGTKTEPSNENTSSPCWFSPVLSEKAMPQPGREASGRLSTNSV